MDKTIFFLIVCLLIVIVAGVLIWIFWPKPESIGCTMEAKLCPDGSAVGRIPPDCEFAECPVPSPESVGCTKEAKLCPDGSAVGRIPPNCEFAECPEIPIDETADWQIYKDEEYGFEIKYPMDFTLLNQYGETYLKFSSGEERRIYVSAGGSLSVMDSTSFGGRYPYTESQILSSKVFSEQDGDFQKDYFVFYGGMAVGVP